MAAETDTLDHRYETKFSANIDVVELGVGLASTIKGELHFDEGSKAFYATNVSNYHLISLGVVLPGSEKNMINTVVICSKYEAPLLYLVSRNIFNLKNL